MGNPERAKNSLLQALCQSLAESLGQASRSAWTVTTRNAEPAGAPEPATSAIFRIAITGTVRGELFLAFSLTDLPQLNLGEADAAEQAVATAVTRCASNLHSALTGGKSGDVSSSRVDAVDADEQLSPSTLQLATEDQTKTLTITVFLGQTLMDSMETSQPDATDRAAAEASANLDLVLDVELDVTLRFGQRQLPLRDVLELKSGAVVELDRQVDEPVELVLDGKVIALGEAVIIDGNYGIRVTQVMQGLLAS